MDDLRLLIDLHLHAARQGPGGDAETCRAIELSGLRDGYGLKIADIGCGTGASTLVLARELDADITAVDFLPEFLDVLKARAQAAGVAGCIGTAEEREIDLYERYRSYFSYGFYVARRAGDTE